MKTLDSTPYSMHLTCPQCRIRTRQRHDSFCAVCGLTARRAVLRGRIDVLVRWLAASLIEGVLGLLVGLLAFVPLLMVPQRPLSLGGTGVALLLVSGMALMVALSHAWILRPVIAEYRRWAAVDGLELLMHWLVFVALILAFGYGHGVSAIASCISGALAALFQSRLLRTQIPHTLPWVIGSLLAWSIGGGLATLAEAFTTTIAASVVVGVVVARVIYSMFAGPLLSFLLTQTIPAAAKKE